jgi:hypothetical protein
LQCLDLPAQLGGGLSGFRGLLSPSLDLLPLLLLMQISNHHGPSWPGEGTSLASDVE